MKKLTSKSKIVTNQSPSLAPSLERVKSSARSDCRWQPVEQIGVGFVGFVGFVLLLLFALALPSCRAWRTVTTTSTYTSRNDSAQTSISIQTKTVEDYQGKKK